MRLAFGVALCASLALLGTAPAAAQTGNDLFQQALVKERADGDVRGAIRIYERIVREFARDRALAARALVQLGGCHERLGNQEAQRSYRRVVQDYADQTDMVREARARLAALGSGAATPGARAGGGGVTMREIQFDGLENAPFAVLSPDGRKMVYVRFHEAVPPRYSLRVRTLASDQEVVLVDSVGTASVFCQWSPDGSRIAYAHTARELRVIDATGGSPRVLWSSPGEASIVPLDWAPDGDRILVAVSSTPRWSRELVLVSLSGAAPRTLRSGGQYELLDYGQFSPDGNYIAGIERGDIRVWPLDGREEIRITADSSVEEWPFWSPDGRFLVYSSDRSGDKDVWAVPMRGSTPSGPPIRVKAGLGRRAYAAEMTATGGLMVLTYGEGTPSDLFILNVDSVAGGATGTFQPAARYPTQHFQPRWSPDGRRYAYTSRKGEIGLPRIWVGHGAGGQDMEFSTQNHYAANVEWARDGESVLFPGFRRQDGRTGIFRLSLSDRAIEPIHLGDALGPGLVGTFVNLVWMPAAGRYFVQQFLSGNRFAFYLVEADGSGLRRTADSVPTYSWAWPSPDGRHVAIRDQRSLSLFTMDDRAIRALSEWQDTTWFDVAPGWSRDGRQVAWTDRATLRVLDTQDGTARVLVVAQPGTQIVAPPVWTPDGAQIAYILRDSTAGPTSRMDEAWLIPSAGGSPRRIARAPQTHARLRLEAWLSNGALAAGGSQDAYGTGPGAYRHWLLEGFLPEAPGAPRR